MLDFKLYAITDRWLAGDLNKFAADASRHGLRALRMRERDLDPSRLMTLALVLRDAMGGKKLFLSAPDGAKDAAGVTAGFAGTVFADGIHIPERGIGSETTPRKISGAFPGMLCGASVHSVDAARRAEAWGAHFLTFGAVFETPSKRALGFQPQGLEKLKEVVKAVNVPVFAIGGITPAGAKRCIEQGAWGVAAVRDLILAPNLGERIAEYREVLGSL